MWSETNRLEAIENLKIAGPIFIGQLSAVAMSVTDCMVVGRLGVDALAALSVILHIDVALLLIFMGLFTSAATMTAYRCGRGDTQAQLAEFTRAVLVLGLICGAMWFAILRFATPLVLEVLHVDPKVAILANSYANTFAWAGFGTALWYALRYIAEGMGYTSVEIWVGIFAVVANAVLNVVLVFGWGPIPAMGVAGSGLATAICRCCMPLLMLLFFYRNAQLRALQLHRHLSIDLAALGQIIRQGIPIAGYFLAEGAAYIAFAFMATQLPMQQASAHQIAISVSNVLLVVPIALSAAIGVRVATYMGGNHHGDARKAAGIGVVLALLLSFGLSLLTLAAQGLIAAAFTDDAQAQAQAGPVLLAVAILLVLEAIELSVSSALRCYLDTRIPFLVICATYWLFAVPLAWWMGIRWHYGVEGMWWCLVFAHAGAALLLGLRLRQISALQAPEDLKPVAMCKVLASSA